ncbi:tetraacyldisaccharide 4'-kinase [Flexibacter flexilis DSM 6793]|uniref:Tetraacyldisaccharide 4'-kinase n=1 Tax=Flexibacter flexilis DSM 6793 TaxID=927664 RepID=A0A1I1D991_9BACT|nr:tetraacyldisaccharide 4'-kinase [Flexibacter flexilis]SFB71374.1 tetraacyldisaccharide 4'-kinase [Flexibacter flexilis DSM 6793]
MSVFQYLLFPFAVLYDAVTRFRNHLFDIGTKKSVTFDLPVINVGNLAVGGTGKTPHAAYLAQWLLSKNCQPALLSRGYGRKTKGYRLATSADTAETLGDEPMQFYRAFGAQMPVAVGEDRVLAIPSILLENPEVQAIVLDDAFQHRYVSPSVNLLLTDFARPFYDDFLLPMGRLREARKGARRAHAVIVTKCPPSLSVAAQQQIAARVRAYTASPDTPVFFSYITYAAPTPVFDVLFPADFQKVVLFSGLANAAPLAKAVSEKYELLHHFDFADHHRYSPADLQNILEKYRQVADAQTVILCTEKDMVKLLSAETQQLFAGVPLAYWPIRTAFFDKEGFELFLEKSIFNKN